MKKIKLLLAIVVGALLTMLPDGCKKVLAGQPAWMNRPEAQAAIAKFQEGIAVPKATAVAPRASAVTMATSREDRVAETVRGILKPKAEAGVATPTLRQVASIPGTLRGATIEESVPVPGHRADSSRQLRPHARSSRKALVWERDPRSLTTAQCVVVAMARVETGCTPRRGASGEMESVLQWLPATWKAISTDFNQAVKGRKGPLPLNLENEELVATWKCQQFLAEGHTPEEIGRIWNTSLGGKEFPYKRIGVNDAGVSYNSVRHGEKVRDAYHALSEKL